MSKKEKIPSTPEMRAQKLARNAEKRKIFGKTFEKAFGIMLALLLVYSVCSIAFKPATATVAPVPALRPHLVLRRAVLRRAALHRAAALQAVLQAVLLPIIPLLLLRTTLRLLRAMPQLPQSFPHQAR